MRSLITAIVASLVLAVFCAMASAEAWLLIKPPEGHRWVKSPPDALWTRVSTHRSLADCEDAQRVHKERATTSGGDVVANTLVKCVDAKVFERKVLRRKRK
jgi:hypothetical protein